MSKQLTWQAVAFLAIVGALVVALAGFTDWGSGEILAAAGLLLGVGGGAAIGGAVSSKVDDLHADTTAQTTTLDTIARRVNGELDNRIGSAMEEAAETGAARAISAMLSELRKQGVIK